MKLRRLTDAGIEAFSNYLAMLRVDPSLPPPVQLLDGAGVSEPLPTQAAVEQRAFASRLAAAEYLHGVLAASELKGIDRDRGLWTWLTLYYFDQVCPLKAKGSRSVKHIARYIPELSNYLRFYRHLLVGPYFIYKSHADLPARATVVLISPLAVPGEVVEQIASRQELISNKSVLGTLTKLYVDENECKLKRGAGGKGNGAARRFADVLGQFERTYDLYAISESNLYNMLPHEFERFQNAA
jgi:hypothetical protein